jgi:hypothetical protein
MNQLKYCRLEVYCGACDATFRDRTTRDPFAVTLLALSTGPPSGLASRIVTRFRTISEEDDALDGRRFHGLEQRSGQEHIVLSKISQCIRLG